MEEGAGTRLRPYHFANRLWIEHLLPQKSPTYIMGSILLLSSLPWIVGLCIAAYIGRLQNFLQTPAFYLGSVGIFVTLATLLYGSKKQYSMYERFLTCFDLDEEARREKIMDALARHSSFPKQLRASAIIFFLCALTAASGFLAWPNLQPLSNLFATRMPIFDALASHGWYDKPVAAYSFTIVLLFALFISATLGTSASIMIRLPRFLLEVASRKPVLPPNLIKNHFSPVTSFYTTVSILWLVCCALVAYFIGANDDILSRSIPGILIVAGLINFILPQFMYMRVISKSEDIFLNLISKWLLQRGPEVMSDTAPDPSRLKELADIEAMLSFVQHDDWVYPLHQTYSVIGTAVLSLVGWEAVRSYLKALI
jgi:hypothetical protein